MNNKRQIAKLISTVGNPLVLSLSMAILINFKNFTFYKALELTTILLVGVISVLVYIYYMVKNGKFADYDVSDRTKRQSLYRFIIVMMIVMLLALYFTQQEKVVFSGALAVLVLIATSYLINFKVKASLHTSFAFLIATMAFKTSPMLSLILLIFALMVAWSRLALHRHTLQEVFYGASLGMAIGILFQYYNSPLY